MLFGTKLTLCFKGFGRCIYYIYYMICMYCSEQDIYIYGRYMFFFNVITYMLSYVYNHMCTYLDAMYCIYLHHI